MASTPSECVTGESQQSADCLFGAPRQGAGNNFRSVQLVLRFCSRNATFAAGPLETWRTRWPNRPKNKSFTVPMSYGRKPASPTAGTKSSIIRQNRNCGTRTNPQHCVLPIICSGEVMRCETFPRTGNRRRHSGLPSDPSAPANRQYPSAQPSLRGSEPAVSVPLSQSIQIAWPPPSGPTTLVVLCPSFCRPSTMAAGTPSSS
jgi:hypothetical protein